VLTLSARHLHCLCCHFVLKQLALLQAFENNSALKALSGQFLKLWELDYWNGTVLNVEHGMIPVLHVLLLCSTSNETRKLPFQNSHTSHLPTVDVRILSHLHLILH
jgi:hypothetical protein